MKYAVAYRTKWASGKWDETPKAVMTKGGRNLDLLLEKIHTDETLKLEEIRVYDSTTMNLPEWLGDESDRGMARTTYLYQEYNDGEAYGEEINKTYMNRDNAKKHLLRRFFSWCRSEFNEEPEDIEEFLEMRGMEDITVEWNEVSFVYGDDKYWWRIKESVTSDEDPLLKANV